MLSRVVGGVGLFLALALLCEPGAAEWYIGGYGGFSSPSDLTSVTMPDFGRRSALSDPLLAPATNPELASLTQTFKTTDVKTESSPIFGGKVGYFFNQQQFPWLGVELEVFTTKPDIEAQAVQTNHDIQFNPVNIAPGGVCSFYPTSTPTCPQLIHKDGSLQVPSSSLRVFTAAANVLIRYPGGWYEPYVGVGVGVGAFYFRGTGTISGDQVVPGLNALWGMKLFPFEEWGLSVEGKYNRATISSFDSTFGISATYNALHVVGGVLYRY